MSEKVAELGGVGALRPAEEGGVSRERRRPTRFSTFPEKGEASVEARRDPKALRPIRPGLNGLYGPADVGGVPMEPSGVLWQAELGGVAGNVSADGGVAGRVAEDGWEAGNAAEKEGEVECFGEMAGGE